MTQQKFMRRRRRVAVEHAPDAELVREVLEGHREAYSTLVRRHQDGLYRHAVGMGLDHDTALDLVQDAFVRAYTELSRCRERHRFRSWVLRILRHRCLDHLKDIRQRSVPLEEVPLETAGQDPVKSVERTELRQVLGEALGALPADQRDAFLMKHLDELTYPEMAEIEGVSESAMKMRVHRAREALRCSLLDGSTARSM